MFSINLAKIVRSHKLLRHAFFYAALFLSAFGLAIFALNVVGQDNVVTNITAPSLLLLSLVSYSLALAKKGLLHTVIVNKILKAFKDDSNLKEYDVSIEIQKEWADKTTLFSLSKNTKTKFPLRSGKTSKTTDTNQAIFLKPNLIIDRKEKILNFSKEIRPAAPAQVDKKDESHPTFDNNTKGTKPKVDMETLQHFGFQRNYLVG